MLALDAHGGDQGQSVSVPASLLALEEDPRLKIILVGDRSGLERTLDEAGGAGNDRVSIHHADSVLPMDAKPVAVL